MEWIILGTTLVVLCIATSYILFVLIDHDNILKGIVRAKDKKLLDSTIEAHYYKELLAVKEDIIKTLYKQNDILKQKLEEGDSRKEG